jgi:hypothetical protein
MQIKNHEEKHLDQSQYINDSTIEVMERDRSLEKRKRSRLQKYSMNERKWS